MYNKYGQKVMPLHDTTRKIECGIIDTTLRPNYTLLDNIHLEFQNSFSELLVFFKQKKENTTYFVFKSSFLIKI